jgi:hypothetical protein
MIKKILSALILSLSMSGLAAAECKANLFADDWEELRTVNAVNDFCSKRAGWFRVDTAKHQQRDYCFSSKVARTDSYGRQYYVYPTLFWFQLKSFSGYDQDDVLGDIHYFLRDFSYKGWASSIKIKFEPSC